jgi:hypothetical protein
MSHILLLTKPSEPTVIAGGPQPIQRDWSRSHMLFYVATNPDALYAFTVVMPDTFHGDDAMLPAQQNRNLDDELVQVLPAYTTYKDWKGIVLLHEVSPGSVMYGNDEFIIADRDTMLAKLRSAYLYVRGFPDLHYWHAYWDYTWVPEMAYDPKGSMMRMPLRLIEVTGRLL